MIVRFGRISALLLVILALALGACGRKGDLKAPEDDKSAYTGPGTYPAPDSVVPQEGASSASPDAEDDPENDPGSEMGEEGAGNP